MSRAVGIDLGKPPTPWCPYWKASEPSSSRTLRVRAPPRLSSRSPATARGRGPARQEPGGHQRRPHHPLGQAPHGRGLDRRDRRQEVRPRRSAPASLMKLSATPRPTWASTSPTPSSRCPPTSTTPSARRPRKPADRRPQRPAHRQRAHRRGLAWSRQGEKGDRPSWSSTSVAAPSTSRCSEIGDGVVEVKAPAGDNKLGGDDWDERIVEWLVDKFKASRHRPDQDKMAMQRLREAAEKAKIEALASQSTSINLPYITVDADEEPAVPRRAADAQRVPEDHQRSAGAHPRAVPGGHRRRRYLRRRHRPRGARRRLDPYAAVTDLVKSSPAARSPTRASTRRGRRSVRGPAQAGVLRG